MWKNPLHSAVVFGIGVLFYFLVEIRGYTVLQLITYIALLFLALSFAYVNGQAFLTVAQGSVVAPRHVSDCLLRRSD